MTRNVNQYHANVEQARHNREMERLQAQQNLETNRANLAKEKESFRSHYASELNTSDYNAFTNQHLRRADSEQRRSNLANELITAQRDANSFVTATEGNAVKKDELVERKRSNRASEENYRIGTTSQLLGDLIGAAGRIISYRSKGNTRSKSDRAYQRWQQTHPVIN